MFFIVFIPLREDRVDTLFDHMFSLSRGHLLTRPVEVTVQHTGSLWFRPRNNDRSPGVDRFSGSFYDVVYS